MATHKDNQTQASQTNEAPKLKKEAEQHNFFSVNTVTQSGKSFTNGLKFGVPAAMFILPVYAGIKLLGKL